MYEVIIEYDNKSDNKKLAKRAGLFIKETTVLLNIILITIPATDDIILLLLYHFLIPSAAIVYHKPGLSHHSHRPTHSKFERHFLVSI